METLYAILGFMIISCVLPIVIFDILKDKEAFQSFRQMWKDFNEA